MPTLFLAPTAKEARRAAWEFLQEERANAVTLGSKRADFLDPPLIFSEAGVAPAWRVLACDREEKGATRTIVAPRLVRAEAFFARSYASLARKRALSGADRFWVLQSAARRAGVQNREWESDLERIATRPEALKNAAHLIAGLRRAGLNRFPAAPGAEVFNALLGAYDARLDLLEAFDFEAAPALFPESAAKNRAFAFPRALIVDDLSTIAPALQLGLSALLERAEVVAATLIGEENSAALVGAVEFWKAQGADIRRVGDWQNSGARVAARILGQESRVERPSQLFLTPAHTPRDEMERIAAHIRAEVENGARPDDFALGCADFAVYEADARHAFAQSGVPLDWPLAPPLHASPLVRALLCALESGAQPLDVHALHDLFGDGTLRWQSEEKTLDARRLRAAGLAARHPELGDLAVTKAAFERKCAQLTQVARHDDAPNRAAIEAALLAGDLELVAEFEAFRAPLQKGCAASVWHAQVLEITNRLAAHWIEVDSAAGARAQNDLARFKTAVENVANRARGWDDERENEIWRSASEWMSWLEMEIESGAAREVEVARGGVRVAGIETSLIGARATFWCGLSERVWPRLAGNNASTRELEAILNAHQAAPLARATHTLSRGASENAALYLSHALYLDGQETPASPLVDDLRAAFPNAVWPALSASTSHHPATRRQVLQSWNRWIEAGNAAWLEPQKQLNTLSKLRAERRAGEIGVYDGVLGARGRDLMAERDQNRGGARLSGSDLEFYARCPIRYFFERVLELRHPERLDDDIDAREAGTLIHEIARVFIQTSALALQNGDFEAALAVLGEIARAECQKLPIRAILREAEWRRLMGFDGQSGPLARWLQLEISGGNGAWGAPMRPILHADAKIDGIGSGLEHRFEIELGGHKVKGFIDRIDISSDGAHLAIIDYKSGDIAGLPSWKAGDNGLHFQLAVYALAVKKLAFEGAAPRLAMAYLSLKRAKIARGIGQKGTLGKSCIGAKMLGDDAFEAWLDDVSARAARIGDLRGAGVFNITLQSPKDAKCDSCASKSLCGQHAPTQAARFDEHRGSPFVYLPLLREWET